MIRTFLLAASLLATGVQAAAPQQMNLVYDLYRDGYKLGQVTDTFTRTGSRYTLTSETRATGPLKMLWPGNIRLESTGEVTQDGLRPIQFEHARSDAPHKLATARLDWKQGLIAYQYKGRSWQVNGLKAGTQDQLSQLYQFMFLPVLPKEITLQVTSGKKLNDYLYTRRDGGSIRVPAGQFAVQQFVRVRDPGDEKAVTVWVAPGRDNLPVQIRVTEDNVTLEQRLVSYTPKQ
ncbi:MAG: DUF3108 domain-containing protein [Thiobacillus sp.]|uniref:DUF3108 domain-containing protein n=1 Tax=Thiobacillus sp. TaxID=924 RepID=UPI002895319D|nr:DUF3108 domain-containing protein [Thiobacillus sp.]MDT3705956.1 DUF3108 domain-containing protein [Thiobacillus sp.]